MKSHPLQALFVLSPKALAALLILAIASSCSILEEPSYKAAAFSFDANKNIHQHSRETKELCQFC